MTDIKKIIIRNETAVPLGEAIKAVARVVEDGLVSTGRYGPQHCFASTFANDDDDTDRFTVQCHRNKKSELFVVMPALRAGREMVEGETP